MALQTHEPLDALLAKVRQMGAVEAPASVSPTAKAEAHDHARSLGIRLVAYTMPQPRAAARDESDTSSRQRSHPMA